MHHQLSDCVDESTDLALLWQRLCEGRLFVSQTYCEAGRSFAVLEARAGGAAARARYVQILERIFEGESQKAMACELEVSIATLAGYCHRGLSAFMTPQWVSRAPLVVVMAALAARGTALGYARCDGLRDDARWLLSVETPGQTFRDRISSAELEVVQLSIQGEPHASVAQLRGTSLRTVANQLASAFAKLKVSGRSEVRALAIREHAARLQTQPPPALESRPPLSLAALASRQEPTFSIASVA
jgi:DNA-binding CsgD family transcriptional regulator